MTDFHESLTAALARSAAPAERFAAVLAEHDGWDYGGPGVIECEGCGWKSERLGPEWNGRRGVAHRAHVAAALAAVADDGLAERVRALAERWEARADDFMPPVSDIMWAHAEMLRALLPPVPSADRDERDGV